VDLQKGVLKRVFGQRPITRKPEQEPHEIVVVTLDECAKGVGVALAVPFKELLVGNWWHERSGHSQKDGICTGLDAGPARLKPQFTTERGGKIAPVPARSGQSRPASGVPDFGMGVLVANLRSEREPSEPDLRLSGVGAASGRDDADGSDQVASLVSRASRGEVGAWSSLVETYAPRVFAMVRSRVRNPELAEEITQSVFVTVAQRIGVEDGYRESGRFEGWLFRIALNRVRDEARRRKRRGALHERLTNERTDRSDGPSTDAAELGALRDALGRLGEKERELIELRHHGQMSFKQIAALSNEPLGTLLARHHRALKKLRGILESPAPATE
jgi:RNA polymerase sigma-70 factor (ECF subfamily)